MRVPAFCGTSCATCTLYCQKRYCSKLKSLIKFMPPCASGGALWRRHSAIPEHCTLLNQHFLNLRYPYKVWLTTVLASPFVLMVCFGIYNAAPLMNVFETL